MKSGILRLVSGAARKMSNGLNANSTICRFSTAKGNKMISAQKNAIRPNSVFKADRRFLNTRYPVSCPVHAVAHFFAGFEKRRMFF